MEELFECVMNERSKELIRNTIIFAIGTVGTKLIQFLLVPLYTVFMTTEDFGVSDLLSSTVTLIIPILMLGVTNSIIRFVLNQPNNRKSVIKFAVVLCLVGGIFLGAVAPCLNRITAFRGFALYFPILYITQSFKTICSQYSKGIEKNKTFAVNGMLNAATLAGFSYLLIGRLHYGVQGYLYAIIISDWCSIIFLATSCHIIILLRDAHINWLLTRDLLQYSVPLMPNELSWWIIQMSDRYMLAYLHGAKVNGIYSMAYKIPSIFNLVVSIFISAFSLSAIKEYEAQETDGKFKSVYFEQIYQKYIAITFLAAVLVILSSKLFAYFLLKNDFFQAWVYIPLLICAFAIGNLESFYGSVFSAIKHTKPIFISTVTGGICNIILNLLLIPQFKAYGAALATIVGYFVVYIVRVVLLSKYFVFDHHLNKIIGSLVGLCVMSIMYIINSKMSLCLCIITSVVVVLPFKDSLVECFIHGKRLLKRILFRSSE